MPDNPSNDKVGTAGDQLFGSDLDDTLSGGDGNDVLGGGEGGSNVLMGGAGSDAFVYALPSERHDTVIDFQQGQDVIDLWLAGIGTFATVQQLLSDDAEGNAVITTTYGGAVSTVTLLGVSAAQLTEADFLLAGSDAAYQDIQGTDSVDDLLGGGGRDGLRGYAGDDRLLGEQGNDSLLGDAGDDQMFGGEGDDQFYAGAGADLLDGGEGRDYASYTLSVPASTHCSRSRTSPAATSTTS